MLQRQTLFLIANLFLLPCLVLAANPKDLEKLSALKQDQATYLDLSNVDLRGYPFKVGKLDFQNANFSHSNLSGMDLSRLNLQGADFSYADLSKAKLNETNLNNVDFSYANLSGAEIKAADLSHANLSHAVLVSVNLHQSRLNKANLVCSNLNASNLTDVNFSEANVSGATFVNSDTTSVIGYESVYDNKITCNDTFNS